MANVTIAPNSMSHVGFRLGLLELTFDHSKCLLGRWTGVAPNICGLLVPTGIVFLVEKAKKPLIFCEVLKYKS